jgi:hypothetical protein
MTFDTALQKHEHGSKKISNLGQSQGSHKYINKCPNFMAFL